MYFYPKKKERLHTMYKIGQGENVAKNGDIASRAVPRSRSHLDLRGFFYFDVKEIE
jgi:tetrahydromethanopterin S-methyltransferase subunit E